MKKFDLGKIEKVDIRNIWEHEGTDFTPWLAKDENIELLGSAIGIDLIVEAVFEDPKIKAEITQEVEGIIPKHCIFASNTSTLPITDLAKASSRPDQFIGIHFFSPVEKMRLVEIIRGKETNNTAANALARTPSRLPSFNAL